MQEITVSQLEQLIADGRRAAKYALEHYAELTQREKKYTLYGPVAYGIGAGMPGKFIPPRSRKLQKQTRRKDYMVYELDSSFNLLQTTVVRNHTEVEIIYYCFELEGIQYACSFCGRLKKFVVDEVLAVGYQDARPVYLGFLRTSPIVQYFEYVSPEKVLVTTYTYTPISEYTIHGYPVDHNAPIGALNSPVQKMFWEEVPAYTDFSQWFQ